MTGMVHLAVERVFCRVGRGRLYHIPHSPFSLHLVFFAYLDDPLAALFSMKPLLFFPSTSKVVQPLPAHACAITCQVCTNTIPQRRDKYI